MKRGFTFVELLVVFLFLIFLGVLLIFLLNPIEIGKRARDNYRLGDLQELKKALDSYLETPNTLPSSTVGLPRSSREFGSAADGSGWVGTDLSGFVSAVPIDPLNSQTIKSACSGQNVFAEYQYVSDGKYYLLRSRLESPLNKEACRGDGNASVVGVDWYEVGNAPGLGAYFGQ